MLAALNPTMHFQVGNIRTLPVLKSHLLPRKAAIESVVNKELLRWLA